MIKKTILKENFENVPLQILLNFKKNVLKSMYFQRS